MPDLIEVRRDDLAALLTGRTTAPQRNRLHAAVGADEIDVTGRAMAHLVGLGYTLERPEPEPEADD